MSYMYHSMEFAVRSKNYNTISMKGAYHSAKDRGHSIKEVCSLLNDCHLSSNYWNKWLDKGDFLSGCIVTIFETLHEKYRFGNPGKDIK